MVDLSITDAALFSFVYARDYSISFFIRLLSEFLQIARLEEEKDQLQDTVKQLKKEMDDMRQKIQVMNNEKASIKDIIEVHIYTGM